MLITAQLFTNNPLPSDAESLLTIGLPTAKTIPLSFWLDGRRLPAREKSIRIEKKHYGCDVSFYVEGLELGEGLSCYLQSRNLPSNAIYDVVIAKPSLEMRFNEFLKTGIMPKPQHSDIGTVTKELEDLAKLLGVSWSISSHGDDYVAILGSGDPIFSPNISFIHQALLVNAVEKLKEKSCKSQ